MFINIRMLRLCGTSKITKMFVTAVQLFSIAVKNILTLFPLRSLALHLLDPSGKNIKHLSSAITNSFKRTNMACQYVIHYNV